MNQIAIGRRARPHYAKVVALVSSLAVMLALMMPFATGPMGMVVSGWRALGDSAFMVAGLMMLAFMCGLFGLYLVVTGAGVMSIIVLMQASSRITNKASELMAAESGNQLADAMTSMMAAQVGLSWGAMFAFVLCGLLCATPLFYRR
ncbi:MULTISPECIES: hypothetical protein [Aeromonas]|uniref:hypothetical protein n=1 Tax=Aeromonas TaxID=642 RepID=UPI0003916426|nr:MULTISPECIES: hypothetical protein [Aeromonas]MBL0523168.1 hypothetical protein [Aeromonas enteropelogenes]QMS78799.1 hypothetical protein M001_022040 [Aeromonas veronii Hm21]